MSPDWHAVLDELAGTEPDEPLWPQVRDTLHTAHRLALRVADLLAAEGEITSCRACVAG